MGVYLHMFFTSSVGTAGKVSTDAWVGCALIYILTLGIESNPRIVNISRITGTVKASHCVYTLKMYCALRKSLEKGIKILKTYIELTNNYYNFLQKQKYILFIESLYL
jgi:hypothetical protein